MHPLSIVLSCQNKEICMLYAFFYVQVFLHGFPMRSIAVPWTFPLPSVSETLIYGNGFGFWERTVALPEDRCLPYVRRTKELILHIATFPQLINKYVFGV